MNQTYVEPDSKSNYLNADRPLPSGESGYSACYKTLTRT